MDVYKRILQLCELNKITPTFLEQELKYGRGYIGKIKDMKKMPESRLREIANYFGVSIEYLMTGKDSEKESNSGKKYYFSDETAQKAQELFENPELRILFDAARDSKPENLELAAEMLRRFKGESS